jgi:hypothetical protein
MTGTPGDEDGRPVESAYGWVASLIALARDLTAVGADVDLAPIRPRRHRRGTRCRWKSSAASKTRAWSKRGS